VEICFAEKLLFVSMGGSIAMGIYILLRAADRFAANYNSFPGQFDR